MTVKGEPVAYRSFAGPILPAVVVEARADGRFDLDVDVGAKQPWRLTAVRAERVVREESK